MLEAVEGHYAVGGRYQSQSGVRWPISAPSAGCIVPYFASSAALRYARIKSMICAPSAFGRI